MASLHHPFTALPLKADQVNLVVDVGAFQGSVTNAAAVSYPRASIIAFEPTNENAELFVRNTEPHSERIDFRRIALSDCKGEGSINLTTTGGANSIHQQTAEHKRQNPHVRECGQQPIVLSTLDDQLASISMPIDILKIDVEGHELSVLSGAPKTLAKTGFVILEIALSRDEDFRKQKVFDIFDLLRKAGFYLYSIVDVFNFDDPRPELGMAQFDAIFRRS